MGKSVRGSTLTTYEVSPDGESFRLNFTDAGGQAASVELAGTCINQLVLTLPRIARQVLHAKYRDSSLRLVYPLGGWRLEQGAGDRRMILTLASEDGFEVSFAVSEGDIDAIGDAADRPVPAGALQ